MKNAIIAIIVVLAIAGFVAYRVLSNNQNEPHLQGVSKLAENVKIYDVRTPEEFAISHVDSATLLPITEIQSGQTPDVPKDTPIAVYCRSGNRSSQATQLLKQAGYKNVQDLGGLSDLKRYGLEAKAF